MESITVDPVVAAAFADAKAATRTPETLLRRFTSNLREKGREVTRVGSLFEIFDGEGVVRLVVGSREMTPVDETATEAALNSVGGESEGESLVARTKAVSRYLAEHGVLEFTCRDLCGWFGVTRDRMKTVIRHLLREGKIVFLHPNRKRGAPKVYVTVPSP